jgi:DNA-binding transcriptional ArsR family regulator
MRRDVYQAIADPTRRDIINYIAGQTLTANAVAEGFDVSRQAISKHIKILSECGLIAIQQIGRERYCSVQPAKLSEVTEWIESFRKTWDEKFNKLDKLLQQMQTNNNN